MSAVKEYIKQSALYKPLLFVREVMLFPGTIGFMRRYKALPEGSIILVGTPLHRNLGDHLIAEAEKQFLKDCFPNKRILEVPTKTFLRYQDGIKLHAAQENLVFITGGGWMGSLWPDDELILQQMADAFSECKLMIFPQTIFYEAGNETGKELLESAKKTFGKCKNLLICARDRESYEFAKENFGLSKENIAFAPDIALYYTNNTVPEGNRCNRAGLYLRNDREKVSSEAMQEAVECISKHFELVNLSTIYSKPVGMLRRKNQIRQVIYDMKKCDIILTDRLHAMIFAVIAEKKCIAVDNKTHKVRGVAEGWLKWNSDIMILTKEESVTAEKINNFINSPNCDKSYVTELAPAFYNLKKILIKK